MSKMKKVNKRKGITLIEVIISVALIAILLIPLTNLVMTSIKKNKKAEVKQEATNLGQKIVEELKAQDTIQLHDFDSSTNIGQYTTLDGYVMNVSKLSNTKWKMEGAGDKDLVVEATFNKNSDVKYNNNKTEVDKLRDDQYAAVIKFTGDFIKWATTFDSDGNAEFKDENKISIFGCDVVKLNIGNYSVDKKDEMKIINIEVGTATYNSTGEVDKITINRHGHINDIVNSNKKIKIIREDDFGKLAVAKKILVYIRGDLPKDDEIDIDYIDRGSDVTRPMDLRLDYSPDSLTEACKINLKQNISESEIDTLHSLYNIDVDISDGTDVLYSSKISVNTDITS